MSALKKILLSVLLYVVLMSHYTRHIVAKTRTKKRKHGSVDTSTGSFQKYAVGNIANEALVMYKSAQDPTNSPATSIELYESALELQPIFPVAQWNLGLLYQQTTQFDKLHSLYSTILKQEAWKNDEANVEGHDTNNKNKLAEKMAQVPIDVVVMHQLSSGTVKRAKVPFQAGVLFYMASLKRSLNEYKQQQHQQQQFNGKISWAQRVKPDFADASFECGATYLNILDDPSKAVPYLRAALQHQPDFAEAAINAGLAMKGLGRLSEAIKFLKKGVKLGPTMAAAHANLGVALQDAGRLDEAINAYQRSVELRPDLSVLRSNLAQALASRDAQTTSWSKTTTYSNSTSTHRSQDEIVRLHEEALILDPKSATSLCALVLSHLYTLSWRQRHSLLQNIRHLEQLNGSAIGHCGNSFYEAAISANAKDLIRVAQNEASKARRIADRMQGDHLWSFETVDTGRSNVSLRHGLEAFFVSSDFGAHSVGSLMRRPLGYLSRELKKLSCLSTGTNDGTVIRYEFEQACELFVDTTSSNFGTQDTLADVMFKELLQSDVVVDLNGLSRGHIAHVLVELPVPTVAFLGFPSPSGGIHDYFATDAITSPPDIYRAAIKSLQGQQSKSDLRPERLLLFGKCYIVSSHVAVDPLPEQRRVLSIAPRLFNPVSEPTDNTKTSSSLSLKISRENKLLALPKDSFIFCNFGQLYKITPAVLDVWANLLRQTPNSLLWILRHPSAQDSGPENFMEEMCARGISRRRLTIMGHVPLQDHISLKRLGDLHLDTFSYNGHTTALDVLWAGLPHLTLSGHSAPSRVGGSILTSLRRDLTSHMSGGWRQQPLSALFQVYDLKGYEDTSGTVAMLSSQAKRHLRQHIDSLRHADGVFNMSSWARSFAKGLQAVVEINKRLHHQHYVEEAFHIIADAS